jgi:hypothetical protein
MRAGLLLTYLLSFGVIHCLVLALLLPWYGDVDSGRFRGCD